MNYTAHYPYIHAEDQIDLDDFIFDGEDTVYVSTK